MSAEFHVSVSADTLAKLRQLAARRGCSMAAVVGQIADSLGAPFEWRGAVREPRPLSAREVTYRRRGPEPHRPGKRYTVWVDAPVHTKLSRIAGRRALTMAGALKLVLEATP